MRVVRILSLLILLSLAGCNQSSITPTPTPILSLTISLRKFEVSQKVQTAIREGLAKLSKEPAYQDFRPAGGYKSLVVQTLVSSGKFETVDIPWKVETVLADIVWAYDRTNANLIVPLPVVLGLAFPNQPYAYFSDWHYYAGQPSSEITREEALHDMRQRLPGGRVFSVTAYDSVTERKILWEQCPGFIQEQRAMPAEICDLGAWIEKQNPGTTALFIQRVEDSFPSDWLLVGWFFAEKTSQSAESWEVNLPEGE